MANKKFKRVENAQDLINALNDNAEELANKKITLDQAKQRTHSLGKILIAARNDVTINAAMGRAPSTSFFGKPEKPQPKRKRFRT